MTKKIGEGKIALLIEDDTVHKKIVKMRLQMMGFIVVTTIHHREADEIISGGKQNHEIKFDLIVSDNNTYEKSYSDFIKHYKGINWIKKLRKSKTLNKNTPTILHTASKTPAKREKEALAAGADVFLHKVIPSDPDDAFLKAVQKAMSKRK